MKKLSLALIAVLALTLITAVSVKAGDAIEIRGQVIDTMCLTGHQADVAQFVKTHTKSCVLAPACQSSGMNIYQADGSIIKLDEAGSKKVVEFLKTQPGEKLDVVVQVKKNDTGDNYQLISIRAQ